MTPRAIYACTRTIQKQEAEAAALIPLPREDHVFTATLSVPRFRCISILHLTPPSFEDLFLDSELQEGRGSVYFVHFCRLMPIQGLEHNGYLLCNKLCPNLAV